LGASPYLDLSVVEREDLFCPQATATCIGWGAMTKLSTPYITFPKQSEEDIEFSNLGQTPGIKADRLPLQNPIVNS
jgi:hypothetical protein